MSQIKGDCTVDLLKGQGAEVLPDRLRSRAIPILVDDGSQRDTTPCHVICTTALFNVFALHRGRLTHFTPAAARRARVHCQVVSPTASPLPPFSSVRPSASTARSS